MSTATICIEQEEEIDRLNDLHVPLGTPERILTTEADAPLVVETELPFVDCLGLCEE
jgi:hypothetical protein